MARRSDSAKTVELQVGDLIKVIAKVTRVVTDERGITRVTFRIPAAEAPITVNAEYLDLAD